MVSSVACDSEDRHFRIVNRLTLCQLNRLTLCQKNSGNSCPPQSDQKCKAILDRAL